MYEIARNIEILTILGAALVLLAGAGLVWLVVTLMRRMRRG